MTKENKGQVIEWLKGKFEDNSCFYVTDTSTLTVEKINAFRRLCFEKEIEVKVVKNTLAIKALESFDAERNYSELFSALKGQSTLLFTSTANLPAKLIKDFRKDKEKPAFKAAYVDKEVFLGEENFEMMVNLKSREELIADVIALLQSPIQKVLGQLNYGANTIGGVLKTLEERQN